MDTISAGKYVELAYKIFSVDENGNKQLEYEFTEQAPDHFVHGVEPGLLEDFSNRLQGLAKGDTFQFTLSPDQAFGDREPGMVMDLERSMFCDQEGNFMTDIVQVGKVLTMMTSSGQPAHGLVTAIGENSVTLDFNHRLAGKSVEYQGHVMLVRDATPDDLPQHHGCGGGCSCESCGSGGDCGGCSDGCCH